MYLAVFNTFDIVFCDLIGQSNLLCLASYLLLTTFRCFTIDGQGKTARIHCSQRAWIQGRSLPHPRSLQTSFHETTTQGLVSLHSFLPSSPSLCH